MILSYSLLMIRLKSSKVIGDRTPSKNPASETIKYKLIISYEKISVEGIITFKVVIF